MPTIHRIKEPRQDTYDADFNGVSRRIDSLSQDIDSLRRSLTGRGGVATVTLPSAGGSSAGGSISITLPSFLTINGGSQATGSVFAVALSTQTSNTIFAGPTSGAAAQPVFRGMVNADLPLIPGLVTGTYGDTNNVPVITVDAHGLVTVVSQVSVSGGGGGGGTGIITAGLSLPDIFLVANSPLTGAGGTISATFTSVLANNFFAGPTSGVSAVPTFRPLTSTDLPTVPTITPGAYTNINGTVDQYGRLTLVANGTGGTGGSGITTAWYQTVRDEGVNLTQRYYLNFTGAGVTAMDDAGTSSTYVVVPGAGNGYPPLPYQPDIVPPPTSGWSLVYGGTTVPTAISATGYEGLTCGNDTAAGFLGQKTRLRAYPTPPFTLTAAFFFLTVNTANNACMGLLIRNAAIASPNQGAKFFGFTSTGAFDWRVSSQGFTAALAATVGGTTNHWNVAGLANYGFGSRLWVRFADNGTNRIFSVSTDGVTWVQMVSESNVLNGATTPDQIGMCLKPITGAAGSFDNSYIAFVHWSVT